MAAGRSAVSVGDGARAWAARTPDAVAIAQGDRALSYRSLVERMNRVGSAVVEGLGIAPGSHSAIFAPNCLEYLELVLGLSDARVAPVLVSPTSRLEELATICNDSESRVLFVDRSLEGLARSAGLETVSRIVVLGDEYESWLSGAEPSRLELERSDADTFMLLYTSGTTGPPKGVVLSQRAKAIQYLASAAEFGIGAPSERSLTVGPLTHGATLGLAIATINAGGRVVALPLFHPEAIFRQVELHRITNFAVVPTHLKVLLEFGASDARELDTSSLRHIVVGGAALPLALKEQAIEFFGPGIVQENYGSSEIGVSSWLRPEDQLRKHGSVGQPFHSVTIRIVGEDGAEVPIGQVGSLQLKAPTAFDGYWRRPADTAAAFRDGFFVTRDLARLDEEGFIYLCDRIDDSINTGGLTVLPREIEDVLVRHPDVAQAVAFGVPDVHLGEAVRAAVVLRPGGERDVRGLLAFSAANLGREKRPKAIDIVAEIPTDATGKILRRRLRDPFWALE